MGDLMSTPSPTHPADLRHQRPQPSVCSVRVEARVPEERDRDLPVLQTQREMQASAFRRRQGRILAASTQGACVRGKNANDLARPRVRDSLDARTSVAVRSVDHHPLRVLELGPITLGLVPPLDGNGPLSIAIMEPGVAGRRVLEPAAPRLWRRGERRATTAHEHPWNADHQQRRFSSAHKPMMVGLGKTEFDPDSL